MVRIPDEEDVVRICQERHGGWNPRMKRVSQMFELFSTVHVHFAISCVFAQALGLRAIVNRVDRDGDVYVECINGEK